MNIFPHQVDNLNTTRLGKKRHGVSSPETMGGRVTNQKKAVCLWVAVSTPTRYPALGMYFKLIKSFTMITGRCGTRCMLHPRNGPACVISLSYGSIKHFIIKHYSKQSVSLKGREGWEVQYESVYILSPLSPYSTLTVLHHLRCILTTPI